MRKIVTIVCLFVFSFLFFNVDNAKAVTTCDYGIECKYSLDGLRESVGGGYLMGGGYLYVAFQCSDISKKFSECSKFTVYPVASKQDMSPNKFFETGGNPGEDLSISDESDILPSKINDFTLYVYKYASSGNGRDKYQIERYDITLDKRFKFQLPDGNDYRLIEHTELFK